MITHSCTACDKNDLMQILDKCKGTIGRCTKSVDPHAIECAKNCISCSIDYVDLFLSDYPITSNPHKKFSETARALLKLFSYFAKTSDGLVDLREKVLIQFYSIVQKYLSFASPKELFQNNEFLDTIDNLIEDFTATNAYASSFSDHLFLRDLGKKFDLHPVYRTVRREVE